MRKALLWIGIVVGVLEIIGTAFFFMVAAAWGALGSEIGGVFVFFVTGPLLVLPASRLAFWAPRTAGMLLIIGGLFSAVWHIGVVMSPWGMEQLFRSEPAFEAWVPLALVSLPMVVLGAVYLYCLGAPPADATSREKRPE
jgi:hypothetical protein